MAIPKQDFIIWFSNNNSANLIFDTQDYVIYNQEEFLIGENSGQSSLQFNFASGSSAKFYPVLNTLNPYISLFSLDINKIVKISTNNNFDLLVRFFFKILNSGKDLEFHIGDLNLGAGNNTAWVILKTNSVNGIIEVWNETINSSISSYMLNLNQWYEIELRYRYPNLPNSTNSFEVYIYNFTWNGNQATNRTLLTSLSGGNPNRKGEYIWFEMKSSGNACAKLDWFRIYQGSAIFEAL